MIITVRFFAISREITGVDHIELELPDSVNVSDAAAVIAGQYPGLNKLKDSIRFAVDDEYAGGERVLHNGQELSFIPPVSGG